MIRFIIAVAIVLVPQFIWGFLPLGTFAQVSMFNAFIIVMLWLHLHGTSEADEHAIAWGFYNGHRLD